MRKCELKNWLIILLAFFCFAWGCARDLPSDPIIMSNSDGPINSSTEPAVLEKSDQAVLFPANLSMAMTGTASNGNVLIFDGSDSYVATQMESLAPGNILVGADNKFFPNGFLRKVVAISKNGSSYSVETSSASLAEAVKGGKFSFEKEITAEDIESFTDTDPDFTVTRVSSRDAGRASIRALDLSESVKFSGKIPIYSSDVGSLSIKVDSELKTSVQIEADFSQDKYLFQARFTQKGDFLLSATLSPKQNFRKILEHKLTHINLARFIVGWIGPVPIWVKPSFPVIIGYDIDISGKMELGFNESFELTCGSKYDPQNGWQPILEGNPEFKAVWPNQASIEGKFQFFFQPVLDIAVCDVAGPEFKMKCPFFEGKGTLTLGSPSKLKLSAIAGSELSAGLKMEIFTKRIAEMKLTRRFEWELASTEIYPLSNFTRDQSGVITDSSTNLQWLEGPC